MDKQLFRKTEGRLYNYKSLKAEVANINIELEEIKRSYKGCSAIEYSEKAASGNAFNSVVENEVMLREKRVQELMDELHRKELIVKKIENALNTIKDCEREYKIIELKYFKKIKTWELIGECLGLSGDYTRELCNGIVNRLSKIIFIGEIYS
ncbi:MAG: siderophore-interacting protein [Clostridium sp.]